MVSLSRYRGVFLIVCALLVAVACVDLTLTCALGSVSRWLPNGEAPSDLKVLKAMGGILSGIVAESKPVGIGTKTPLGILLGQSTLGAAVDPEVLEKNDGLAMRWLNLHGWGGSVNHIRDRAELLFLSGIKPDVVVIGINPYMLVGHNFEVTNTPAGSRWLMRLVKPWIWTYYNRSLVNHFLRDFNYQIRYAVFRSLGLRFSAFAPPDPTPWIRSGPALASVRDSESEMQARLELSRKLGWFDPASYSAESSNSQSLVDLIRKLRQGGAKVYIVLMPENSRFRNITPPEGVRCFEKINQAYFRDDPVPVDLEIRDRAPDEVFRDIDHVLPNQRSRATILFANEMRRLLSDQIPVDKGEVTPPVSWADPVDSHPSP
jgi:hypothetical protein